MKCRQCSVWKEMPEFTLEEAMKHLIEVHSNRALPLMIKLGNLLFVTTEYVDAALRDRNTEGEYV